ncbi:PREDICTED: SRC kinase signaling inhibitor 1 [Gekko japonicus]|uniref:SRC kinase signaling inhibitor 1 n=1 Tax=Gekko japonicus TaxID=146911 RepID=A0ABM1K2H6_GEKJA|nr:PREDICTED: SRC kinase signaling inhibitor 1 [Gekko japonicus]
MVLPFGLASAPRVFTKTMVVVAAFLHLQGISVYPYINDWLLVADSRLLRHIQDTLRLLNTLGLRVNTEKSHLQPAQWVQYIGTCLDSIGCRAFLPQDRARHIINLAKCVASQPTVTALLIQWLLGLMAATTSVLVFAKLRMRPLQLWFIRNFDPVVSEFHLQAEIFLPDFYPSPKSPEERLYHTLDTKRALLFYLQRTHPTKRVGRIAGGKKPGLCSLCLKSPDPERTSAHMISADDAEYPREYRTLGNGTRRFSNVGLVHTSERRHTVIAAQSLEALTGLQKSEMERKRDAFMDHLKSKYPQHALAIRGQQERIRDQQPNYWSFKTRSSRHNQGSQPGLADQAKLSFASAESLETMSEAELPIGFNRMNRFRQSLPLSRSTSQTKLRSPGILFLQFGDETRRVHITHEITSMDTLHALIVHMFPQKLTMGMLKSPNTAILIKDESRNVFYELEDVRDIQDRSIIKIYRKEPLYASFPGSHITNGDLRREMVYSSRESSPTRRLNSMSPAAHLTSGSPPPVLQSSSPSRSRMSYSGGRPPSYAGSPVHHAERLSNLPPAQGVSPSPSAILERRDVKPDEDLAGKNMVLVKNEGLYADPYGMVHEGRLSITSTQSLAGIGDPFAYPGGLYKRGSVRSLSTYSAAALQTELEDSLYKPNAQIYSDTYGPGMGFRLPPSSPQKIADGRLVDVQQSQSPHSPYSGPPSRSSPVRQSFRKDSCSSVFMESPVNKPRNPSSSGPSELFPGPGERPLSGFSSPVPAKDTETRERMEAMEKQIASLTGLVQSALMRSSDAETPNERTEGTNGGTPPSAPPSRSSVGTPVPVPPPPSATGTPAGQPTAITRLHMQLHLHDLQQNASDLRNQLQQLKKLQLQNQETVKTMLRRTETEISVRVMDTMRKQEDPLQRQRTLVEEERLRYLNEEELITQQLNDLEKAVEKIQKDFSHSHRLISPQELEEKSLVLKQLGDTLTDLKANFPSLQSKMRVVLRVEVEAVKFLKEEPHRLDGLFKRCKTVTDTLAQVRRQVDDGVWDSSSNLLSQSPKKVEPESDFSKGLDFEMPTSPPMNLHDLTSSTDSLGTSSFGQSPGQSHISKSSNPSRGLEMVVIKTQMGSETPSKRNVDRSVSMEAAERDWEEKRAALTQYSAKDINRLLEETQAELMKAIPDLEFAAKHKQTSSSGGSGSAASTPEHKPPKPQHAQKTTAKMDLNGRRGSDELTVPRYRTEKPSKSPPPPPPRRSFPSSHGLTTTRTGEVIVTSKKESSFMKKAESEELETQKPQVKLRRTVSEVARPASTPPIIASAIKDDDDEDRIIAELEVFQRSSSFIPKFRCDQLAPTAETWPNGATVAPEGWKNQKSPMNKDAIEYDMESMQEPSELVCPLAGEEKINLKSKPEDQQKEHMSLDNTTLSSHEICKDTYRRLDNLEETIRELEMAISEISFPAPMEFTFPQLRSVDTEKEERKSGSGVSIPAMKMVNPASRLKQTQQGSPDKSKHIKQRMEYMRIQGQQQAARSTKDPSTMNETSSPVSEKPSSGRTSIPVLTSFGSRNSSISF